MKKVTFQELIKAINELDYTLGSNDNLEFKIVDGNVTTKCRAYIDHDLERDYEREYLHLLKDGVEVWSIDPDRMELYDTIRRVSILLNCTDSAKYYIYK